MVVCIIQCVSFLSFLVYFHLLTGLSYFLFLFIFIFIIDLVNDCVCDARLLAHVQRERCTIMMMMMNNFVLEFWGVFGSVVVVVVICNFSLSLFFFLLLLFCIFCINNTLV